MQNLLRSLPTGSAFLLTPKYPKDRPGVSVGSKDVDALREGFLCRFSAPVKERLTFLFRALLPENTSHVLCVGSGLCEEAGLWAEVYSESFKSLHAVDITPSVVVRARYLHKGLRQRSDVSVRFYCGDATSLATLEGYGSPEGGYDVVFMRHPSTRIFLEEKSMWCASSLFQESSKYLHEKGVVLCTFYTSEERELFVTHVLEDIPAFADRFTFEPYEEAEMPGSVPSKDLLWDSEVGRYYNAPEGWLLDGYVVVVRKKQEGDGSV